MNTVNLENKPYGRKDVSNITGVPIMRLVEWEKLGLIPEIKMLGRKKIRIYTLNSIKAVMDLQDRITKEA